MPIPKENAKEIWLAAIADATKSTPSKIDPEEKWEEYMSLAQLEKAYDATEAALKTARYKIAWSLARVMNTNPISAQIDLLAEKTSRLPQSGNVVSAVSRLTREGA